jgi:hypothetical protein
MRRMADSLVEAMGRMFDARLPAVGGHGPRRDQEDHHREESGGENSGFDHGFDRFGDGRGGYGGGRRADFDNQRGGHSADFHNQRDGRRAHEHRVRFEDEEFEDHEEGSDVENPFGRGGRFNRRHHHRRADFEDRGFHRGRRHYDDPDNISHVKLSIVDR